jgi:glycerol-3-phosphate dehydrogenase (NAD(P)+)
MRDTRYKIISIIGDGGMASVLAILLCEKRDSSASPQNDKREVAQVRMWGYDRRQLAEIEKRRENKKFLPGYKLPASLVFEPDDKRIMAGAELIISAVPCQFMRSVWNRLKDCVPANVPIVSVAKGIENETLLRPTQILAEILRFTQNDMLAVLSGPTIADELARKLPATACAAASNEKLARDIQRTFNCPWLRVYTNTDVVGVELSSACKNIIAIAAGIIDGVGAGDNAKAALLTRGLAEITRLGVAMGAKEQTFAGLTGLGDLVTTCISPKGRNRSFGERIGKGQTPQQAERATESVVEGIATCKSVVALADKYGIEMPITQAVYEVLFEDKPVQQAIQDLMQRRLKAE